MNNCLAAEVAVGMDAISSLGLSIDPKRVRERNTVIDSAGGDPHSVNEIYLDIKDPEEDEGTIRFTQRKRIKPGQTKKVRAKGK